MRRGRAAVLVLGSLTGVSAFGCATALRFREVDPRDTVPGNSSPAASGLDRSVGQALLRDERRRDAWIDSSSIVSAIAAQWRYKHLSLSNDSQAA